MEVYLEQVLSLMTTHNEVKIQNENRVIFIGPASIAFESLSEESLAEEVISVSATDKNKVLIKI